MGCSRCRQGPDANRLPTNPLRNNLPSPKAKVSLLRDTFHPLKSKAHIAEYRPCHRRRADEDEKLATLMRQKPVNRARQHTSRDHWMNSVPKKGRRVSCSHCHLAGDRERQDRRARLCRSKTPRLSTGHRMRFPLGMRWESRWYRSALWMRAQMWNWTESMRRGTRVQPRRGPTCSESTQTQVCDRHRPIPARSEGASWSQVQIQARYLWPVGPRGLLHRCSTCRCSQSSKGR